MSAAPTVQSIDKIEITPDNQPANGTFSFSQGTPLINLAFAEQDKLLRCSSLRLNGKISLWTDNTAATVPTNDGTANAGIHLSPKVGAQSIIQNLTIMNSAGAVYESIRNYGRLVSSLNAATSDENDFLSQSVSSLCNGMDATSSFMVNSAGVSFSIPLHAGILQGTGVLPLGQAGTRGLKIQIELAADSQVLFGDVPAAIYQISDVSLTADLISLESKGPKSALPASGSLQYNCWSSLYSTINSADATLTSNLSQSAVLGVSHSFAPADSQNNTTIDSFALMPLNNRTAGTQNTAVQLNRVDFSKSGQKLKNDYTIDVASQAIQGLPETAVLMNNLDCFQPFRSATHFACSPQTVGYGTNPTSEYTGAYVPKSVDATRVFGIGLNLDPVSRQGVAFSGQPYAIRLQSGLDNTLPNAVFTNVLSRATLMWSPKGVSVQG
jgi:hypothetical protein